MWKATTLILVSTLAGCTASAKGRINERSERAEQRYAQIASGAVKKRAAYDFGCTEKSIAVTSIGAKKWGAAGCNERHLYAVNCHNRRVGDPAELKESDCQAILIGPISQSH